MRRNRYRREFLDQTVKSKQLSPEQRKKGLIGSEKESNPIQYTKPTVYKNTKSKLAKYQNKKSSKQKPAEHYPSSEPLSLKMLNFEVYQPAIHNVPVLHVIDSAGLGGAQVMMLELVTAINKYYSSSINNKLILINEKLDKVKTNGVFDSYLLKIEQHKKSYLSNYCRDNGIRVVIHHRTSSSSCLRQYLLPGVKYIIINHSYYGSALMNNMIKFKYCDAFISVCDFLKGIVFYPDFVHSSRKISILNGIENDFIQSLDPYQLEGSFITGRCQRLVPSKFKIDSIKWIHKISKDINGHKHYIAGVNKQISKECEKYPTCHYLGPILDREEKFGILKKFDLYLYETFQNEGASISLLESIACGVPVIAKPLGGNVELIKDGVNGFIVNDRKEFQERIETLYQNSELLQKMKTQTLQDFNQRLHIKHTASKYVQLIEALVS